MIKKIHMFFWLALLAHILIFLSFSIKLTFLPAYEKKEEKYIPVPAYIYREEKNNPPQRQVTPTIGEKKSPSSRWGTEKPTATQNVSTRQFVTEAAHQGTGEQNINLNLKATDSIDKPLLQLLSKATAKHLFYPKIAVDFQQRGKVTIGFMLAPDGLVTEIKILKSSGSQILDNAALEAINAISPVKNVNRYLTKPETVVVGIIFG